MGSKWAFLAVSLCSALAMPPLVIVVAADPLADTTGAEDGGGSASGSGDGLLGLEGINHKMVPGWRKYSPQAYSPEQHG